MYHDILPNFSITPSQVKLVKETSVVKFHTMDLKRKLSKIIGVHIIKSCAGWCRNVQQWPKMKRDSRQKNSIFKWKKNAFWQVPLHFWPLVLRYGFSSTPKDFQTVLKGKLDACLLWPWIIAQSTARDFRVN